ncbi:endonuclease/exonuclease/phosphatase family domain-containing protein 1-like isoform X2 [Scleropages formosus]|uniref:Endonuclease/exonuclease/phosphatase family domain-containing protein 1 n=1 Tax=Scleropages formosus TaxID=113540 RepID=A0A8C9TNV9_SCLFO|nr:endonuclease/exonuclease/phosphatase family domain-containing protein 1-like isoform X2 [Scleropages formosus]
MGGNLGCHRRIPRDAAATRKLSAACSFGHVTVKQQRVNINSATEEELMTLPGVNRAVARSIVQYRERIGGFRKVEDLALVSGVGAAKLALVRMEICVSCSSRRSGGGSCRRAAPAAARGDGVNVNTATAAQLLSIRGVTEKMAENIVQYRREHGPFRSVEDLVRVKRVNSSLLEKIRLQVFVERPEDTPSDPSGLSTSTFSSTPADALTCTSRRSRASPTSVSLRSDEEVLVVVDLPAGGPTELTWSRPARVQPFRGLREGRAVLRVATWSLQRCSSEKAKNPGVREVVCMSVLENGIKLLAVQDLADREALEKFCAELNQGTLPSVRAWKGPRGAWRCAVSEKPARHCHKTSEFCGFLWDSSSGIELKDATLMENVFVNGNGGHAYPRPYLAHFSVGLSKLTVVNVRLKVPISGGETNGKMHLENHKTLRFTDSMQEILKGEKELLVLGDFGLPPDSKQLDLLKKEKFSPLIPSSVFTNISTKAPQGSHCMDNMWLSRSLKKVYTGHYQVLREGLTSPWIPDNWSWGGVASDHCPVLADFYTHVLQKDATQNGCGVPAVERDEGMFKRER